MTASFNDRIANAVTAHAVNLERYKGQVRADIIKMLGALEAQLKTDLYDNDPNAVTRSAFQQARLAALLKQTQDTLKTAFGDIGDQMQTEMRDFAAVEAEWATASINDLAGIELVSVALTPDQLEAIASDVMIEGAPSAEWWARQVDSMQQVFSDTVRAGLLKGQTTDEIVRSVRDNVVMQETRAVDALVRSSIQAVSTAVRAKTYEQNTDVIEAVQQRSVLDSRTTPICQAYSGMVWTLPDYTPVDGALPFNGGPPRHWGCRSTILPVVKAFRAMRDLQTGGRPSPDAETYFESRLKARGMTDEEIARVVRNAQASMDGQVPKDWDYETWLKSKSVQFQKEVLGPGKWALWNDGKIGFSDLVDQSGRPLTLEQLKQKIRKAG